MRRVGAAAAFSAIVMGLFLSMTSAASAGVFDIFGFGSRSIAMGNAVTATADDHTAVFYNPAALTRRKQVHLGGTFSAFVHALEVRQPQPANGQLLAEQPPDATGFSVGVLFPVGGKIGNRVALGLGLYVPLAHALRMASFEPNVPRWYRYNTLADKLHIVAGVGVEVTDWLSLGVGMQSLANLSGRVDLQIDLVNERIQRRDANVGLHNTVSPTAGILVTPASGWRIGAAWRAPVQLDFSTPIVFDFGEAIDLTVEIKGTDLYTPHTFTMGTSYTIEDLGLTVALDGELALWSLAPDPSLRVGVLVQGKFVDGLGLDDFLTVLSGRSPDAGLQDAFTLRFGAESLLLEWLAVRGGYYWRQGAVSEQTRETSYLDSDAHALSVGAAVIVPDPLEINERPVIFDITGLWVVQPEQRVDKESPLDPVGWLAYGGDVFGFAASLRHDF